MQTVFLTIKGIDQTTKVVDVISDSFKKLTRDSAAEDKKTTSYKTASYNAAMKDIQKMAADRARWEKTVAAEISRTDKLLADNKVKEQKRAANDLIRSLGEMSKASGQSARESANVFKSTLGGSFFGSLGANAVSSLASQFAKLPGIVGDYLGEAVKIASERSNALKGLESVALFKGIDADTARQSVQNLRLVKAGILDLTAAATGYKNLVSAGFTDEQAVKVLERFSDAAAFGKQAALSYGDAISRAAEGIKNQNSALVDNVGLTKNLSVILKERGFQLEDLGDKQKGQNALLALYNGILEETKGQIGDADKLTQGWTGSTAALETAQKNLLGAIGDVITQNPQMLALINLWTKEINGVTEAYGNQEAQQRKTFGGLISGLGESSVKIQNWADFAISVFSDAGSAIARVFNSIRIWGIKAITQMELSWQAGISTIKTYLNELIDAYNGISTYFGGSAMNRFENITPWSVTEEGFKKSEEEYQKAIQAHKEFYETEKGWLASSRAANIRMGDRWTRYRAEVEDATKAIENNRKAQLKNPVTAGTGGGSGGGSSRVRRAANTDDRSFKEIVNFVESQGFRVSSAKRAALNDGSLHPLGKAVDVSIRNKTEQEIAELIASALKKGFRVVDERMKIPGVNQTGPHLHFEANNRKESYLNPRLGYGAVGIDQLRALDAKRFSDFRGFESSEAKQLIDAYNDLAKSKEKILELTKELGLAESNYAAKTQAEAESSIKRLETIKDLTGDWEKQTEEANRKVYEIRNSAKTSAQSAEDLFQKIIEQAGLSAGEVEFLRQKFSRLKVAIDEANQASSTRPRVVPWQLLPGNEAALQNQSDPNATRPGNRPSSQFRDFRDSLEEQVDELRRGNRELTEYERVLQQIGRDFQDITPAQREYVLGLAQQIDAQNKFNEQYEKTRDFIYDTLDILTERGTSFGDKMKAIFGSIADGFRRMLVDMASQWLTSKLFGAGPGGQSGGSGGGFGDFIKRIFGGGGGGTAPFNPNAASGVGNNFAPVVPGSNTWASRARIVGTASDLPNFNRSLQDQMRLLNGGSAGSRGGLGAFFGKGGFFGPKGFGFNGGTVGGLGALATLAGGLVGGRFGNVLSYAGTGASIGSFAGPIGGAIGAGIGALIGLFGGDPKRKEDKKQNLPALRQGFADSIKDFQQLIADLDGSRITASDAEKRGQEIRSQIASGFNISFKSRKYRKISQTEIRKQLAEIDRVPGGLMDQLRAAISRRREGEEFRNRFVATFATGGFMDAMFAGQYGDFKRRNGYLSGGAPGRDSLPALLMPKEIVANEQQQRRIRALAGFDVFAYAGIPNYPKASAPARMASGGSLGAESLGGVPAGGVVINSLVLEVSMNASVGVGEETAVEITNIGLKDLNNQSVVVNSVRGHVAKHPVTTDGLPRDLEKAKK